MFGGIRRRISNFFRREPVQLGLNFGTGGISQRIPSNIPVGAQLSLPGLGTQSTRAASLAPSPVVSSNKSGRTSRGLGRSIGALPLGRLAVGGAVGAYSSRNEEGLGWWGGVAGGMAAGGYLGRYMPKRAGTWGLKQLKSNKSFAGQYSARAGGKWTGTGLGGFTRRSLGSSQLKSLNRVMQYGAIAGVAGMGAGLGSSTLRSNRPY
jgi:hypothetical protein